MTGQSHKHSWLEAFTNIVIGFSINWAANMVILPLFGFYTLTGWLAFKIGLAYTAVSLFRQYVLRRYFNRLMILAHIKEAAK